MSFLIPKTSLVYGYTVGDLFWIWVKKMDLHRCNLKAGPSQMTMNVRGLEPDQFTHRATEATTRPKSIPVSPLIPGTWVSSVIREVSSCREIAGDGGTLFLGFPSPPKNKKHGDEKARQSQIPGRPTTPHRHEHAQIGEPNQTKPFASLRKP